MDARIYQKLNTLRQQLAKKHQLEVYMVWNNETQIQLASNNACKLEDLATIKGMGPKKIKMYGQEILSVITGLTPEKETSLEDIYNSFEPGERVLTVALYLDYINFVLQNAEQVKVFGEIFSLNVHPTGVYMTIKDPKDPAVLDCYINPYTYKGLGIPLETGMQVKLSGNPQIFKRRGSFRLQVEEVELSGEGSIKKAYELLKAKLETEGIFTRKRTIPEFISSVGIITSKTGAVIDDFRKNLLSRGLKLQLADVRVEGRSAPEQIINAIHNFNKLKNPPEVLAIMRGGGSLEDLQAFNQEPVVRAIFGSKIPVIAAIGHDRDVPLTCLAADTYTSTPTAAAVAINNSWYRLDHGLPLLERSLYHIFEQTLATLYRKTELLHHTIQGHVKQMAYRVEQSQQVLLHITTVYKNSLRGVKEKIASTSTKLTGTFNQLLLNAQSRLINTEKTLTLNNPERQLTLGYSIITAPDGRIVKSIKQISTGKEITTKLADGSFTSEVTNTYDF